ncbi:MAG: hypothetical protein COB36_05345 [Alphaproteobacteria bacterium]|nr:MAG: hypothetical protein COB36_05345 [Alphaproteobacteria bacterium]
MFIRLIVIICFLLLPPSVIADPLKPRLYDIDQNQSFARFVTKMCTADIIKGEFLNFSGQIYFDEWEPTNSWIDVTLDASSLSLDHEFHKDEILKDIIEGSKILKTSLFSTIKLKSTKIERTSINTGIMVADLTLVGETHPITLEITFENKMTDRYATKIDPNKVSFSAYGTFKRSEWNVLYGLDRVGIRRMSDDVQVFISAVANLHNDAEDTQPK